MTGTPDPVDLVLLAAATYRYETNRLEEARGRWGLGETAFWAAVNAALADPCVAIAAPAETARLIRLRDSRQRLRRPR